MRSDVLRAIALWAALVINAVPLAHAQETLTREQVAQAAEAVRADPNLPGVRREKALRFKDREKPQDAPPGLPAWLTNLARWLSETGRLLVWCAGALLLAWVLVSLRRWVRERGAPTTGRMAALPSHVRDLDIRPDSLPDAIGDAARALWNRGEHRACLSLLYRGALSRLVHHHAVPVLGSSTEGECVHLAAQHAPLAQSTYFARLVRAWQPAVYGARLPAPDEVMALCAEFDAQWAIPAGEPSR